MFYLRRNKPIIYNALLLTAVNLLLRFVSTSFQVYLSGKIGAEGIGLLQLVLSVGGLSLTIGMGGIRTATMYLCAEAVGQKRTDSMGWILSGCVRYSLLLSLTAGALLYGFAPQIAEICLGNPDTVTAIRLLACFLPVNCLCGVMIGHFTGMNRIGILSAVEVAEQLVTVSATLLLISIWSGNNPGKVCQAVVTGSGIGACFTFAVLLLLKSKDQEKRNKKVPIRKKLTRIAIPLALADNIKVGINTTENLMVPKRLSLYSSESAPLAAFGTVCGMVFPLLMFPAAILFALSELMIPELARCNAAGSNQRIRHLTERSLLLALIYGAFCSSILFICADRLCVSLYKTTEAGKYLKQFALLAPILYCDIIVDAATKGLGQQRICVHYNIITSALDVLFLYMLLPKYGMGGYYLSFLITHFINFILSLRLLYKLTGKVVQIHTAVLCMAAAVFSIMISTLLENTLGACCSFIIIFAVLLHTLNIVRKTDLLWIKGLITHNSI